LTAEEEQEEEEEEEKGDEDCEEDAVLLAVLKVAGGVKAFSAPRPLDFLFLE